MRTDVFVAGDKVSFGEGARFPREAGGEWGATCRPCLDKIVRRVKAEIAPRDGVASYTKARVAATFSPGNGKEKMVGQECAPRVSDGRGSEGEGGRRPGDRLGYCRPCDISRQIIGLNKKSLTVKLIVDQVFARRIGH